jgi:ABC-type transport system involved in Fe-S cluster assembly, permease and ATPase components
MLCFRYNIQYGRISASDDDIVAAAKHADIHDSILTFPEVYETKVCFILLFRPAFLYQINRKGRMSEQ